VLIKATATKMDGIVDYPCSLPPEAEAANNRKGMGNDSESAILRGGRGGQAGDEG
jgi:hypothetical protein